MRFFDMLRNERGAVGASDEEKDDKKDEKVVVADPALDEEHSDENADGAADEGEDNVEVDLDTDDEKKSKAEHNAKMAAQRLDQEKASLKKENENLRQTVEELRSSKESAFTKHNADPSDYTNWTDAQWDDLAKKDWKKAVDLRSEIKAREQFRQESASVDFTRVLEESKQLVLKRHPELNDPNSEKAKLFRNIVIASPEYTTMKKGPIHAMREMEEYMELNLGYKREDIVKAENRARKEESERLNRVQISSTSGRNISTENKVTLTKDEIDFCSLQGIDPKTYAANKKKLERGSAKGGIQL